jgi:hypothetical protein
MNEVWIKVIKTIVLILGIVLWAWNFMVLIAYDSVLFVLFVGMIVATIAVFYAMTPVKKEK